MQGKGASTGATRGRVGENGEVGSRVALAPCPQRHLGGKPPRARPVHGSGRTACYILPGTSVYGGPQQSVDAQVVLISVQKGHSQFLQGSLEQGESKIQAGSGAGGVGVGRKAPAAKFSL